MIELRLNYQGREYEASARVPDILRDAHGPMSVESALLSVVRQLTREVAAMLTPPR